MIRDADYINRMKRYAKNNLKKGYTRDSLKQALVNQGHSRFSAEKAISMAEREIIDEAPILEAKPEPAAELVQAEEKKPFWKRFFG